MHKFCMQCGGDDVEEPVYTHRIFAVDVNLHCTCVAAWMIEEVG